MKTNLRYLTGLWGGVDRVSERSKPIRLGSRKKQLFKKKSGNKLGKEGRLGGKREVTKSPPYREASRVPLNSGDFG